MADTTARIHFDEDIQRAETMLKQAKTVESTNPNTRLCYDIRISAIALSVGAMDAYFCDKYVDCLVSVLRAYSCGRWPGKLPAFYREERLPAGDVLDTSRKARPAWGIRMAARKIMQRDNMLSISRIDKMFNPILPNSKKLWADFIGSMLSHGFKRLTGPKSEADINALTSKAKETATKKAISALNKRITSIVQIRHDWIHNCGRPKTAIAKYTHGRARECIRDVKLFIITFDDHIQAHRRTGAQARIGPARAFGRNSDSKQVIQL